MQDYLFKVGDTKFRYILRGGYQIREDQKIILESKIMADGTERQNIAEKRKTAISITFSQIDGETLMEYCNLLLGDFEAEYWSKNERVYKTAVFRIDENPDNSLLNSTKEIYDEFTINMESV